MREIVPLVAIVKITNLIFCARSLDGETLTVFRIYFSDDTLAPNPSLSRRPDGDRWRCALIDVRNLISEMRQREEEFGKCMRPPVAHPERKEILYRVSQNERVGF